MIGTSARIPSRPAAHRSAAPTGRTHDRSYFSPKRCCLHLAKRGPSTHDSWFDRCNISNRFDERVLSPTKDIAESLAESERLPRYRSNEIWRIVPCGLPSLE